LLIGAGASIPNDLDRRGRMDGAMASKGLRDVLRPGAVEVISQNRGGTGGASREDY